MPHLPATVGRYPHFVGVRRYLTRRPGRAGQSPGAAIGTVAGGSATCPVQATWLGCAGGAAGGVAPRPDQVGGLARLEGPAVTGLVVGPVLLRSGGAGPAGPPGGDPWVG